VSPAHDAAAGVGAAVTALFVPGDRPERFAKAAASGADVVIIDLEDAVHPGAKDAARQNARNALRNENLSALVRINAIGSPAHEQDVAAFLDPDDDARGLLGVLLPKAEDPESVTVLGEQLAPRGLALVPIIESAAGLLAAPSLAAATGVTRLAFGALDYALDISAGAEERFLDHARSAIVVASRAHRIAAPLDSPSAEFRDVATVRASADLAHGFGFGGKLCVHPAQIGPVAEAFRPAAEEVAFALAVREAVDAAGSAWAVQVNGAMVDRPVIERADRVLALAGITSSTAGATARQENS
jgi:citrate lyase subunit beta/citryl-CoA lyase